MTDGSETAHEDPLEGLEVLHHMHISIKHG